MIHAIDFDGILCEARFPAIGRPFIEEINFFKKCRINGDKLILWTCRSGVELEDAVIWCRKQGLEFDAVNDDVPEIKNSDFGKIKSGKVYADIYWDDRNGNKEMMVFIEASDAEKISVLLKKFVPSPERVCSSCGIIDSEVKSFGIQHCPNPFCPGPGALWFSGVSLKEDMTLEEFTQKAFRYTHQLPVVLRVKILTLPSVKALVKKYMKGQLS